MVGGFAPDLALHKPWCVFTIDCSRASVLEKLLTDGL